MSVHKYMCVVNDISLDQAKIWLENVLIAYFLASTWRQEINHYHLTFGFEIDIEYYHYC